MLIRCVAPYVRRWEFHADCTHASFPRSANFFFSPQRDALDCGAKAHPLSGCITEQQKLLRLPRWLKFLSAPSAEITNANSKIGSQGETRAQFSYTHIPFLVPRCCKFFGIWIRQCQPSACCISK